MSLKAIKKSTGNKYFRNGGDTLFVADPNDPRLKAYKDSTMYAKQSAKEIIDFDKVKGKPQRVYYDNDIDYTESYPPNFQPIATRWGEGYPSGDNWGSPVHKLPVQPVAYKKQPPANSTSTNNIYGNAYHIKYPPIYVTDSKDPRIGQYHANGSQYRLKPTTQINKPEKKVEPAVKLEVAETPTPKIQITPKPALKDTTIYEPNTSNLYEGKGQNVTYNPLGHKRVVSDDEYTRQLKLGKAAPKTFGHGGPLDAIKRSADTQYFQPGGKVSPYGKLDLTLPQTSAQSTSVDTGVSNRLKVEELKKDVAVAAQKGLADKTFEQKYGKNVHAFQLANDSAYKAKATAEGVERAKTTGGIDYSTTDTRRIGAGGSSNPNSLAALTSMSSDARTRNAADDYHSGVISALLPIPGLEAVGKVPSVYKALTTTPKSVLYKNLSDSKLYERYSRLADIDDPQFKGIDFINRLANLKTRYKIDKETKRISTAREKFDDAMLKGAPDKKLEKLFNEYENTIYNSEMDINWIKRTYKQGVLDRLKLPINYMEPINSGAFGTVFPTKVNDKLVVKVGKAPNWESDLTYKYLSKVGKKLKDNTIALPRNYTSFTNKEGNRRFAHTMTRVEGTSDLSGLKIPQESLDKYIEKVKTVRGKGIYPDFMNPQNMIYDPKKKTFSLIDMNTEPPEGEFFREAVNYIGKDIEPLIRNYFVDNDLLKRPTIKKAGKRK